MHIQRRYDFALLLLGVLLAGCGPGADLNSARQKVFKVNGKITMNGAPVANAMVSFSPKAQQPAATGRTAADGAYVLTTYDPGDGAAAGDYVVLVTKELAAAGAATPDAGHDPTGKKFVDRNAGHAEQSAEGGTASTAGLPEKYGRTGTSDLTATVKADGSNAFSFDLKP